MGGVMLIVGFILPRLQCGYPWGLNIAFVAIGFMMIGNCLLKTLLTVRSISDVKLFLFSCALAIATSASCFNKEINMANAVYGNPILFLLFALIGSSFIIGFAMLFERVDCGIVSKWFLYIGQNSLTIMLLHKPIISTLEKVFAWASLPDCVSLLVITVITVVVCCWGCIILNACVPQIVGHYEK